MVLLSPSKFLRLTSKALLADGLRQRQADISRDYNKKTILIIGTDSVIFRCVDSKVSPLFTLPHQFQPAKSPVIVCAYH